MTQLFENEDFRLLLTGHDYDFVGIIETKTDNPLTFFFSEEYIPHDKEDEDKWDSYDYEINIDEEETTLLDVYKGLKEYNEVTDGDTGADEEQELAMDLGATSYLRTREDKSTGFLSCPKERGHFLAIVKAFCPEKLKEIPWA